MTAISTEMDEEKPPLESKDNTGSSNGQQKDNKDPVPPPRSPTRTSDDDDDDVEAPPAPQSPPPVDFYDEPPSSETTATTAHNNVQQQKLLAVSSSTAGPPSSGFGHEDIDDLLEQRSLPPSQYRPSQPQTTLKAPSGARKSKGTSRTSLVSVSSQKTLPVQPPVVWNRATQFLAATQLCTLLLAAAAFALGLVAVLRDDNNNYYNGGVRDGTVNSNGPSTPSTAPPSLLDIIYERGYLNCGFPGTQAGFVVPTTTSTSSSGTNGVDPITDPSAYTGFDVDLCRALAAAIFASDLADDSKTTSSTTAIAAAASNQFRVHVLQAQNRWAALNSTQVDVVFQTSHTMQRDVYVPEIQTGVDFGWPYFYDGMIFGGLSDYVACAEQGAAYNTTESCRDLQICVVQGTTFETLVTSMFPGSSGVVVLQQTTEQVVQAFPEICQVVTGTSVALSKQAATQTWGVDEDLYTPGTQFFSREPLATVTRQGDARWTDFVNYAIQSLIYAETREITKATALQDMPTTTLFGPRFARMFQTAVAVAGNYGELYEENLEAFLPRQGPNQLNIGTTPRLLTFPLGDTTVAGPPLEEISPTVQAIRARGFVNCGMSLQEPFFRFDAMNQEFRGFSSDLCRAIGAALFDGIPRVLFTATNLADRFPNLQAGRVDVIPMLTAWTVTRDANEPTIGTGLSFGTPYGFVGNTFGGLPEYVECADRLDVVSPECQDMRICTLGAAIYFDALVELIGNEFYVVTKNNNFELYAGIHAGECQVVYLAAGFSTEIAARFVFGYGTEAPYVQGQREFGIEIFATVTREDDPAWTDFVRWIVMALIYAEQEGITQETAARMPRPAVFGSLRQDALYHAVNAVGNYGELWNRDLFRALPRTTLNQLSSFTEPRLFPIPGFDSLAQA